MFSFMKPKTNSAPSEMQAPSVSGGRSNAFLQDQLRAKTSGPASSVGPFANGVSRGDFLWALSLQRPDLRLGTRREDVIARATQRNIITQGKTEDIPTRAEAAVMVRRALSLDRALPKDQIAYFTDVQANHWYFNDAHVCRRFGLFHGDEGINFFRGSSSLSLQEAETVIERCANPIPLPPEKQVNGTAPLLKPATGLEALEQETLSAEQIAFVRKVIASLPKDQQANLYKLLSGKSDYRNQRDNEGTYASKDAGQGAAAGDTMCNMTSIAMALNQLGVGVDESEAQFEDLLDEQLVEDGQGSRYSQDGQAWVVGQYGVTAERKFPGGQPNAEKIKTWFETNISPDLQKGAAATMGMRWGQGGKYSHIVRVQWVEADGLRVDDPYGTLYKSNGVYTYTKNDTASSEDEGARGEDNLWSWQTVCDVMKQSDRYVQVLNKTVS